MVGPLHPAWAAFTDDDWNGATFVNWVRTLEKLSVRLCPPVGCVPETVQGVKEAVARYASEVSVGIVHVLRHGQTLCLKPGIPGDWDDGDIWVGFQDSKDLPQVTCSKCRHLQGLLPHDKTEGA